MATPKEPVMRKSRFVSEFAPHGEGRASITSYESSMKTGCSESSARRCSVRRNGCRKENASQEAYDEMEILHNVAPLLFGSWYPTIILGLPLPDSSERKSTIREVILRYLEHSGKLGPPRADRPCHAIQPKTLLISASRCVAQSIITRPSWRQLGQDQPTTERFKGV